ncbi:DUF3348 family protein [Acidovorax sp. LjRoot194]|uniref:DUF3348 family protein n=1 Tax=Acidovorax sp. LjRoot194 TaxID=3342280 RepID=UPI003F4F6175
MAVAVNGFSGMYPQHTLSSSGLVVLLQQWMQADAGAAARADVAQELGQWLSTVDAVTLSRSLHAIDSFPQALAPDAAGVDMVALEAAFEGTQAELTALASSKPVPPKPARERADNTRAQAPDPQAEAEYGFHAPRYLGLQKQMDAKLLGLRAQVRHGVSQGSRRLRQLAALDTVMEQLSFVREQRLWASLSAHLDRRLVQLRRAHQERLSAQGLPDEPQRWRQPGGWLHAFERDMQALLLAEMHVRLQPILGLLEAARNENMERHE